MNLVIIGCGQRANGYLRYILQAKQKHLEFSTDINCIALFDLRVERAVVLGKKYGCHVLRSKKDLAKILQVENTVPLVCTPDETHLEYILFLKRNIPNKKMIVEKPVLMSHKQLHAVKTLKHSIFVPLVLRYVELYKTFKSKIKGCTYLALELHMTPEHTASFVRRESQENPLKRFIKTKLCHDIDLVQFLLGSRIVSLRFGHRATYLGKGEKQQACKSCDAKCVFQSTGRYSIWPGFDTCVRKERFFKHIRITGRTEDTTEFSITVHFKKRASNRLARAVFKDSSAVSLDYRQQRIVANGVVETVEPVLKSGHMFADYLFLTEVLKENAVTLADVSHDLKWMDRICDCI